MKTPVLALFCILIAGCSNIPQMYRPVDAFRQKHPAEFAKYTFMNPIDIASYSALWSEPVGESRGDLEAIRDRFGTNEDLRSYVQRVIELQSKEKQQMEKMFADLSNAAIGGSVCQYEYVADGLKETGILVVKNGDVIRRESMLTEILSPTNRPGLK